MDGRRTTQEMVDAFAAFDKVRKQAESELIEAANQAFGKNVFYCAGFVRDSQGVVFKLTARIPVENESGFWDEG